MKTPIKGIIYLIFILSVISCLDKHNSYRKNELLQIPQTKTKFTLNIDDSTTYTPDISQIFEENGSYYFYGLDIRRNQFDIFNINSNVHLKKARVMRNDSIKLNGADMFYVSSLNKIFLFKRYPSTIIITDSSLKKYDFFKVPTSAEIDGENSLLLMNLNMLSKSVCYEKSNNMLYFPIYNYVQNTYQVKWDLPVIASYSITDNKVINTLVKIQEEFRDKKQGISYSIYYEYPNFVIKDSLLVVSFANNHSIYVYNKNNGKFLSEYDAKSNFFDDFKLFDFRSDAMKAYNFLLTEPAYINIIYDNYRKYFYRICKHGHELKKSNGEKYDYFDCEWSILVLNEDFSKIGEINLPNGRFNFISMNPVKEGLLIQNVSPKEGVLSFELLDIGVNLKK